MMRDVFVLAVFAFFGTLLLSIIAGIAMWFLPWSMILPAFLVVLALEGLFVFFIEEILQKFGYKFSEQR